MESWPAETSTPSWPAVANCWARQLRRCRLLSRRRGPTGSLSGPTKIRFAVHVATVLCSDSHSIRSWQVRWSECRHSAKSIRLKPGWTQCLKALLFTLLIRRRRLVPFGVRRRLRLLPIEPHLTPSPSLHSGAHAWLPTSQSSTSAPFNPKSAPPPHDNPITAASLEQGAAS